MRAKFFFTPEPGDGWDETERELSDFLASVKVVQVIPISSAGPAVGPLGESGTAMRTNVLVLYEEKT